MPLEYTANSKFINTGDIMKKLVKIAFLSLLAQASFLYAMDINTLYGPSSSNDSGVQITNSSGADSVIQYTKIRFYTTSCNTALGAYPISGGERNFVNGGTVSINSGSMYKIATAASADTAQIGCARILICSTADGTSGKCNDRGTQCPSFTLSCTGTTCSSNNTINVTSYTTPGAAVCII